MKVVVNGSRGTFGIPDGSEEWLETNSDHDFSKENWYHPAITTRTHPDFVRMVEEFCPNCRLKIVDVPDEVDIVICESGGYEWVAEKHRKWEY